MNGWEVWKVYQPLLLHFTTKYDVLKYGGKAKNITHDRYIERNDKTFFEHIATKINKSEVGQFCIANFAHNEEQWLYTDTKFDIFTKWKSIRSAITQNFTTDIKTLSEHKAKLGTWGSYINKTSSGRNAPLLQMYLHRFILPETMIILDKIHPFLDVWEDEYPFDPLAEAEIKKLTKYRPFSKISLSTTQPIFDREFQVLS
jgi:hypothetical protein